ncbi:MAG: hypothetical protein Kow0099_17900 [Candidatus Abyssubacteria bacterium]
MRTEKINTLVIETPEGISFSMALAGPITRFYAWAIDLACISVITTVTSQLLYFLIVISRDLGGMILILLYFGISIGYGIVLEWFWRGQTIGKRVLKLRVVDEQGLRLQFSQVAVRNLLRFIDALPLFYLVGGVACVLSRRAQRLGDYAANTVVIRSHSPFQPNLEAIESGKYNSFREYPHLEARLRQKASPQEAAAALHAVLRRDELDPPERVRLFSDFAFHFRSLVTFPEEATFGLTDEQYVRNVVDSLFRTAERKPVAKQKQAS